MKSDIGKRVNIRLTSAISYAEGETESVEMWLDGHIVEKNGTKYLRYTEEHESQSIKTTIKLAGDQSFIMRKGSVDMRLPLNVKQRETGHYTSEVGSLPLWIDTAHLHYTTETEQQSQFETKYALHVGGQLAGTYTLKLTFTEE